MKKVVLSNSNKVAIVDDEDFEKVSKHTWYLEKSRSKSYPRSRVNGKLVRLHRFLLKNVNPKTPIDHIDNNTLNNRRKNLRIVTPGQNITRGHKTKSATGFRGVYFHSGKYAVYVGSGKGRRYGGFYDNVEAAARSYNKIAKELYGECAILNEVD